jgi:hypothetical protein
LGSLVGIFFEPSRIFESFRRRPRFLLAAALIALTMSLTTLAIYQKIGFDNILRAQLERSATQLTPEQRESIVDVQGRPLMRTLGIVSPIITLFVVFAAGAGLYLAGVMAVGSSISYRQALSVWVFSAFPPAILSALGTVCILLFRSRDDIDPARSANGLIHANPSVFFDALTHPVLATAASSLDLLALYGLILAIIGLHKVARLSPAKAAGIAGSLWLASCLIKIGVSAVSNAALG